VDQITRLFLKTQREEGMQLASQSDLLDLHVLDEQHFVASYGCRGLVRESDGRVTEHDRFDIGIWLSEDYLRIVDPAAVLSWLGPETVHHPNIRPPYVCLGRIAPGTPLIDLLHRCFELVTYENVTMQEFDALNRPACAWARRHRERFPIDTRPIKWRAEVHEAAPGEGQPQDGEARA